MSAPPAPKLALLLAACALLLHPAALAQDSRPRRVPPRARDADARPVPTAEPAPRLGSLPETDVTTTDDVPAYDTLPPAADAPSAHLESEPTVRVGLTTSARAVNISTAGQLLLA